LALAVASTAFIFIKFGSSSAFVVAPTTISSPLAHDLADVSLM
jgi:hypothetical protein